MKNSALFLSSPLELDTCLCTFIFFLFLGKIKIESLKMHEMSSTLFAHIYVHVESPAQHSRMLIFSVGNRQNEWIWESQICWRSNWKFSLTFSGKFISRRKFSSVLTARDWNNNENIEGSEVYSRKRILNLQKWLKQPGRIEEEKLLCDEGEM